MYTPMIGDDLEDYFVLFFFLILFQLFGKGWLNMGPSLSSLQ